MLGKACATFGLVCAAALARAADTSGYASVGTDYVFRGVSLLEHGPALDAGVETRFDDGWLLGAEAARIDREWDYRQKAPDHARVDLYTGADFGCGAHCRARVLVSRYLLPGAGGRDWSEASASVALFERAGLSYAYSPYGLGSHRRTQTLEGWLQLALPRAAVLELGYGHIRDGAFGYAYARAGVSRRFGRVVADLAWHASDRALRRFVAEGPAPRLVLTLSTGF